MLYQVVDMAAISLIRYTTLILLLDNFNHLKSHLHTADCMIRARVVETRNTVVAVAKNLDT